MTSHLSSVVESMMNLYNATTSTESIQLYTEDIYEHAVNFLMKTKGVYNQSEWEAFLKDLQKKGIDVTEETMSYLYEIFETAKNVKFTLLPTMKKAATKEMLKKVKETKTTK